MRRVKPKALKKRTWLMCQTPPEKLLQQRLRCGSPKAQVFRLLEKWRDSGCSRAKAMGSRLAAAE